MRRFTPTLPREIAVAFSRGAQPVWFRIVKWIILIVVVRTWWGAAYFWPGCGVALSLALALHFFYRRKTHGWTRPWGGWNDPKFVVTAGPAAASPRPR